MDSFIQKFREKSPTPRTASTIIAELIRDTDAFDPKFFKESFAHKDTTRLDGLNIGNDPLSRRPAPKRSTPVTEENLRGYGRNWHAITRTFALNFPTWVGIIGNDIEGLSEKYRKSIADSPSDKAKLEAQFANDTENLQKMFIEASNIIGDDTGRGGGAPTHAKGVDAIHYNLYAKSLEKLGLAKQNLDFQSSEELAEATNDLTRMMREKFKTLVGGVAVLAVVEHIAESAVEAQHIVNLSAKKPSGEYVYDPRGNDIEYHKLHIGLETQHAGQSDTLMDHFLAAHPDQAEKLVTEIGEMTEAFARFWDAMNQLTFGKKSHYEGHSGDHRPVNATERESLRRGNIKRERS